MTGLERLDAYEARWGGVVQAYIDNPAPFEAERVRRRAIFNAAMAGHDARVREEQERRWAEEEQA